MCSHDAKIYIYIYIYIYMSTIVNYKHVETFGEIFSGVAAFWNRYRKRCIEKR